ncbi:MAG: hypothetical protein SFX72_11540 [Isosphaeraceae bacterium]|nr:hypothetical protein [Isosphaeraceae bacterium]
MRREFVRVPAPFILALGLLGLVADAAQAQNMSPRSPRFPDVNQRSGLLTRFQPLHTGQLPSDPHRDNFYKTRFGDYPVEGRSNWFKNGGLYGQPLSAACTQTVAPYFDGSAGGNANCKDCRPWSSNGLVRLAQGFVKPFKPVGGYYQNGSYVPIYDLDPLVVGPGVDLWPHYIQIKDDAAFFGH